MKIARHWTGLCKTSCENDYVHHLQHDTFIKLRSIEGFVKASILKKKAEDGVEFLIITEWESVEAIRKFAGDQYETAVVPPVAREMMVRYDSVVRHYEVQYTTA
jgi:heme-degrading monooxygenase HmoA